MNSISSNRARKNSLIELMRFLFALWVVYYHGFIPFRISGWSNGFLAVEFFFILSGFYLVRSIDKYKDAPIKKGLPDFLKHRFKAIAVPFIINEIFVLYYSIAVNRSPINFFFGFLWYIRDLFIAMAAIFLLRRLIKNEKVFYIILCALSLLALFGFWWIPMMAWPSGPFRSIAAMPIGMIAALIPKLKAKKDDGKKSAPNIILIAVGLIVSATSCFLIASSETKSPFIIYLLIMLIYPALLYFASCVKINNSFLNWLGTLSFPIYAFQCPLRVLERYGVNDSMHLFIILVIMVLCYSAITECLKWRKIKKTTT